MAKRAGTSAAQAQAAKYKAATKIKDLAVKGRTPAQDACAQCGATRGQSCRSNTGRCSLAGEP